MQESRLFGKLTNPWDSQAGTGRQKGSEGPGSAGETGGDGWRLPLLHIKLFACVKADSAKPAPKAAAAVNRDVVIAPVYVAGFWVFRNKGSGGMPCDQDFILKQCF